MFRCIPLFRGCNRQVEYIDKRHCSLPNVPDDVLRYARTLEELLLDANHIRELPRGLFRLTKLRRLSASDNEICRIPPDIANLMNLVELDLSKNDIPDIPENIKFLKSLQSGDFSSNPLAKLPSGFVQLRNLTLLGLNDVSLTQLPNDFGSLSNLQSVELRENLLKTLPASFALLVKLERLDLGSNEIEELPPLVGQLSNLQELWLDCNELTTLPKEIGNCKKLTCLDISENRVEYLPEEVSGLESLTDLHLSQNSIEALPEGIGCLTKLTIFKVDQNRLVSLTPAIGKCVCLQELILTENLLTELPESIGHLTKLTNLNVDRNALNELPNQIGNLTRLGVLSLRDNHLSYLPLEMGKLKELHVLDVSGNRLQFLPFTITALNLKALWLAENQSQPMLKFQTDVDQRTGMQVLTCFLLPQMEYHPDSMENLLRDSTDSRLSWDNKERISAVKFAEEDDKEDKEAAQFVRHDTPHPRELKARHQKLFNQKGKQIDGHVLNHDEQLKENGVDEMDQPRTQRMSTTSTGSTSSEASGVRHNDDDNKGVSFNEAITHHEKDEDKEAMEEGSSQKDASSSEGTSSSSSSSSSSEEEEEEEEEEVEEHEATEEQDEEEEEDDGQPKEIKHVGFIAGGVEESNSDKDAGNRLHRRDTPHHLKNKRVHLLNSKEAQEKVATILAQVLKKEDEPLPPPPPSPPAHNQSMDSSLSAGKVSPHNNDVLIEEEQLEIILERKTSGLGLSIAGGKGSTPYKGNDEGIFISRITEGGPSDLAGLRIGDKLIGVNDVDVSLVDHYEAVNALKAAGECIKLKVLREIPRNKQETPSSLQLSATLPAVVSDANKEVKQNVILVEAAPPSPRLAPSPQPASPLPQLVPTSSPRLSSPARLNPSPFPQDKSPSPVSNYRHNLSLDSAIQNHLEDKNVIDVRPVDSAISDKTQYEKRLEIMYSTLIRDQNGLGFSIAGGQEGTPYNDSSNQGVFISRIAEGGSADRDGKLKVGDQILSINGVNIEGARHDQVINMLTGLERYVRLVVQREQLVAIDPSGPKSGTLPSLPKPTLINPSSSGGVYSTTSYMANRPSYLGSYRKPGITTAHNTSFEKPRITSLHNTSFEKPAYSIYTKLPGLRNDPESVLPNTMANPFNNTQAPVNNVSNSLVTNNGILPNSVIVPKSVAQHQQVQKKSGMGPLVTVSVQQPNEYVPLSHDLPPAPTGMGKVTESLTKTTVTETTTTRITENQSFVIPQEEDVTLVKAFGPLGLSIIGGSNHSCHPFGGDQPGIFISKIVPDGAAANTGKLRVGDRLLMVNGVDVSKSTHQDAVLSLLAPTYEMTLRIRHDPLPKGWQEFTIVKEADEKLGMNIKGGARGHPGNPLNKDDEGVFISRINPDGAVAKDGRLRTGMRIVEVNGVSLLGASHQEAVNALRNSGDVISLLVCQGYDPGDVDSLVCCLIDDNKQSSMLSSGLSSSSLDREDEGTHALRKEREVLRETAQWEKEDLDKVEKQRKERELNSVKVKESNEQESSLVLVSPKSVDQKVLEVVRAAEQLVKPVLQNANTNMVNDVNLNKEQKTTTIILSKHSVDHHTSTPLGERRHIFDPPLTPAMLPLHMTGDTELDLSSDSLLDPIGQSRIPGAKTPPPPVDKAYPDLLNNSQPEQLTFSEKKRRFEEAMQQQQQQQQFEQKRFSFFTEDELEKMKEEEERKIQSMTQEEFQSFKDIQEDDEEDKVDEAVLQEQLEEQIFVNEISSVERSVSSPTNHNLNKGILRNKSKIPVRTAKAERRSKSEEYNEDNNDDGLTPAQLRAVKAEKRAAWRQARLKSLEEDAFKAQIVIQAREQELKEAMERKPAAQRLSTVDIDLDIDGIDEEVNRTPSQLPLDNIEQTSLKLSDDNNPDLEDDLNGNELSSNLTYELTNSSNDTNRKKKKKKSKRR